VWRGPLWFAWRTHDDFHRVEIPDGGYALTLFIKGKVKKNNTFFLMDDGTSIKDLKYWKQWNIDRKVIGDMIKWKTPKEVKIDIKSR
jgi:hypothetical protein